MSLDNPDGCRKEIELFPQAVLKISQKRKMQTGFAAGCEDDKSRRPHGDLRDVLNVQARTSMGLCRRDACSLPDFPLKEFV